MALAAYLNPFTAFSLVHDTFIPNVSAVEVKQQIDRDVRYSEVDWIDDDGRLHLDAPDEGVLYVSLEGIGVMRICKTSGYKHASFLSLPSVL